MEEYINISHLELTQSEKDLFTQVCKYLFPLHKLEFEEYGLVTLIKENWANPESFRIGWLELCIMYIYPKLAGKYSTSYMLKSLGVDYINKGSQKAIPARIIKSAHAYMPKGK